jgi:two-component system NarL family sensor kinase
VSRTEVVRDGVVAGGGVRTPPVAARSLGWRWPHLLALTAAVGAAANIALEARSVPSSLAGDLPWFGAWLAYLVVGALVVQRRPELPIGPVLVGTGALVELAGLLDTTAVVTAAPHPGAAAWMAWGSNLMYVPAILLVAVAVPLLLPAGRLGDGRRRTALWVGVVAWGVFSVGVAVQPGSLDSADLVNPLHVTAAHVLAPVASWVGGLTLAVVAVGCVVGLASQWRSSSRVDRRALAFVALGAFLQLGLFGLSAGLDSLGVQPPRAVVSLGILVLISALPVSVGLAILRAGLLDIELVLRRTLAYLAMTLVVVALYAATVLAVGTMGGHSDRLSVSLLATGLAAVGLSPLRERAQRQVDRLLYGRRADPYGVLRDLDQAMARAQSTAEVLPTVARVIGQALRLPYVAILLPEEAAGEDVEPASWGQRRPIVRELPLEHHSRRVGTLLLAARSPGERFSALDDRLLTEVGEHAGSAVAAVGLAQEAQRSRQRLVLALEDDRRRIRRDLHDHLGPVLSGMALQLDQLRRLSADNQAALALADTIRGEVADAVVDIRRLVHGLRPPILDELGLAEAVRHRADLMSAEPVVTVDIGPLPPLPAAVEVAAYRIVTEALTNVIRHAGARSAHVRIAAEDRLLVEVCDDGHGIAVDGGSGIGFASMRERVAELGGSLSVTSSEAGCTVRAELPT